MEWIQNAWANFSPSSLWKRWRHPEIREPHTEAEETAAALAVSVPADDAAALGMKAKALLAQLVDAGKGSGLNIPRHPGMGPQIMERAALLYLEFRATMLNPVFRGLVPSGVMSADVDKMALFDNDNQRWIRLKFNNMWRLEERVRSAEEPYGSRNSVRLHYTKVTGPLVDRVHSNKTCPITDNLMCSTTPLKPSTLEKLISKGDFKVKVDPKTGGQRCVQYPFKNWIDGTAGKVFFGDMQSVKAATRINNDAQLGVLLMRFCWLWGLQTGPQTRSQTKMEDVLPHVTRTLGSPLIPTVKPDHVMNFDALDILAINWLLTAGLSKKPAEVTWPLLCLLYNNDNERQVKAASLIPMLSRWTAAQTEAKGLATNVIDMVRMGQQQDLHMIWGSFGEVQQWDDWYSKFIREQKECGITTSSGLLGRSCSILKKEVAGENERELRDELVINKYWTAGPLPSGIGKVTAYSPGAGVVPLLIAGVDGQKIRGYRQVKSDAAMDFSPPATMPPHVAPGGPTNFTRENISKQGVWFMVSLPKMPHTLIVIVRMGLVFTIGGGYDPKDVVKCKIPGLVKAPLLIFSPDTAIYGLLETVGPNQFKGTVRSDGFFDQYITNAGIYDDDMEQRLWDLIAQAQSKQQYSWTRANGQINLLTCGPIKNKGDVDTFQMPLNAGAGMYSSWSGQLVGGLNCASVALWIGGIARGLFADRPNAPPQVAALFAPRVEATPTSAHENLLRIIKLYTTAGVVQNVPAAPAKGRGSVVAPAMVLEGTDGVPLQPSPPPPAPPVQSVADKMVQFMQGPNPVEAERAAEAEAAKLAADPAAAAAAALSGHPEAPTQCAMGECALTKEEMQQGTLGQEIDKINNHFVSAAYAAAAGQNLAPDHILSEAISFWVRYVPLLRYQPWWHFLVSTFNKQHPGLTRRQNEDNLALTRAAFFGLGMNPQQLEASVMRALTAILKWFYGTDASGSPRWKPILLQFITLTGAAAAHHHQAEAAAHHHPAAAAAHHHPAAAAAAHHHPAAAAAAAEDGDESMFSSAAAEDGDESMFSSAAADEGDASFAAPSQQQSYTPDQQHFMTWLRGQVLGPADAMDTPVFQQWWSGLHPHEQQKWQDKYHENLQQQQQSPYAGYGGHKRLHTRKRKRRQRNTKIRVRRKQSRKRKQRKRKRTRRKKRKNRKKRRRQHKRHYKRGATRRRYRKHRRTRR